MSAVITGKHVINRAPLGSVLARIPLLIFTERSILKLLSRRRLEIPEKDRKRGAEPDSEERKKIEIKLKVGGKERTKNTSFGSLREVQEKRENQTERKKKRLKRVGKKTAIVELL